MSNSPLPRVGSRGHYYQSIDIGEYARAHLGDIHNKFTGPLHNPGFATISGNVQLVQNGSANRLVYVGGISTEAERNRALPKIQHDLLYTKPEIRNPLDDRDELYTFKTFKDPLNPDVFSWFLDRQRYKTWEDSQTGSQLLWICGGPGMGKTMLSLFLTRTLEKKPQRQDSTITLYYFCEHGKDQKNNGMAVLRGLIFLLLKAREKLVEHIYNEYGIHQNALFSQMEVMWKIFECMVLDPRTGPVYCIIDGLDECNQESLFYLLLKIKDFYRRQVQNSSGSREDTLRHSVLVSSSVDGSTSELPPRTGNTTGPIRRASAITPNPHESGRGPRPSSTSAQLPYSSASISYGLKMLLLSRETPKCLPEQLSEFPKIQLRPPRRNTANSIIDDIQDINSARNLAAAIQQHSLETPNLPNPIQATLPPSQRNLSPPGSTKTTSEQAQTVIPGSPISSIRGIYEPFELPAEPVARITEAYDRSSGVTDYPHNEQDEEFASDTAGQNDSLQIYIKAKVEELSNERHYSPLLQTAIIRAFEDRGDGTLLWVHLAIEKLKNVESHNIREILLNMPLSLDEMYCRTLQEIPSHLGETVASILRWVVAARSPLNLVELSAVLNLSPKEPAGILERSIAACGNIITVEEDLQVSLVHSSARDFLTGNSPLLLGNLSTARFRVQMEEADREIALACITYLEQGCMKQAWNPWEDDYHQRVDRFPLLGYAAASWPEHARAVSRPFLNLSSPFFMPDSPIRRNWWYTFWSHTTGKRPSLTSPWNFTLLHLAAYLNIRTLAQQLMRRGELKGLLDKTDSHGETALSYAVKNGHMDMFLFLLQLGAKQATTEGTILELACERGQRDIVDYLLNLGYNSNEPARDIKGFRAFGSNLRRFHGVLNQVAEMDRDKMSFWLNFDVGDKATVLQVAALYGHAEVVALLIERGANVRGKTTKGWTALHSAAWTGQIECVRVLLEHGASSGARTESGWTPLHCAAARGKYYIVRLLLDIGVPVDSITSKHKTAMHLSAANGDATTLCLLYARGARLEAITKKGETPLHVAAKETQPEATEVLLNMGADRWMLTYSGKTPLELTKPLLDDVSKETARIIETYGRPDYEPWKPPVDNSTVNFQEVSEVGDLPVGIPPIDSSTGYSAASASASMPNLHSSYDEDVTTSFQGKFNPDFQQAYEYERADFNGTVGQEYYTQNTAVKPSTYRGIQSSPGILRDEQYLSSAYPSPPPAYSSLFVNQGPSFPEKSQNTINRPEQTTTYSYGPPATGHRIQQPVNNPPRITKTYSGNQQQLYGQEEAPETYYRQAQSNNVVPSMMSVPTAPTPQLVPSSPILRPRSAPSYDVLIEKSRPPINQSYDTNPSSSRQQSSAQQRGPQSAYLNVGYAPASRPRSNSDLHGAHGQGGLYFAPPPTTATPSLEKKRSWTNLGGLRK